MAPRRGPRRARRRAGRLSSRGLALAGLGIAAVAVAVAGVWFAFLRSDGGEGGPPRAAIVDQLSVNVPNPDFRETATETLEQAGYLVDYYPGEQVTVDFYRHLPSEDYDVIVFRSHADRLQATTVQGEDFDEVILFTAEEYSKDKYVSEQSDNRLVIARYFEGGPGYFGIASGFIEGQPGDYDGATIIMMGCEGLLTDATAKAFVSEGAKTYISWNETVTADHTDAATDALLRHLLTEGETPGQAVAQTMSELGPDPVFGSELEVYPNES